MPEYNITLDRRQELQAGTYSAGTGKTTWNLYYGDPSINCLVLSSGASAGTVITTLTLNTSTYPYTVQADGNYPVAAVVGILYTFDVELTDPVRIRQDGSPDFTSRMAVRTIDVAYHESAGFGVKREMTNRTDRTVTFAGNADGSVTAKGVFRANLNGNTNDAAWSIVATQPKRVVVPSVEFLTDINTRRDG